MASIRDIAKMAGVSAASVSRILNNDQTFSINENTRQRVIEIANQVNYSKEKNLRGSRNVGDDLSIALITRHSEESESDDPYFQHIRKGIEKEAAKWRLKVVRVFRMRDKLKDWQQLKKYKAVILIGEMDTDALEEVKKYNDQIILVDNYQNHSQFDCIQTDFAWKTHEILDTLFENGHRNIAFIGGVGSKVDRIGDVSFYQEEVRAEQYRQWMKLKDLEQYSHSFQKNWTPECGLQLTEEMLQLNPRPTAVVVASDPMAVGVYRAINDHGLRIPEDISVISFDDIEMARYMSPALSTVRMNAQEMGRIAVNMAKERILGTRTMPITVICSSQLIARESVGRISKD
ncbi:MULTISPECIES: LacI family DNA-binding transcriptional regulator [Enterococcus]|uniref:LacI family DNA-binding transcriptional regulator n=1 Tax=Enterococcus TaxID=1350 RepID=UPI00065E33BB|nr:MULTISPECIES: LacI family DNA-binding transcriptional regulator [Enterococcus]KAF1301624.1 LacI family transcriptional regulator [Enterococcus sp. JM9B]